MSSAILFSDIFQVKDIDPEGKRFDRVSRLNGRSESYEMDLTLDYQSELYPLEVTDKFSLALATTLSLSGGGADGGDDEEKEETQWRERHDNSGPTLADSYDYVMHGRVYKYEETDGSGGKVAVYVSYGGLLMCLEGDYRHLQNVRMGEQIFLLLRK